MREIEKNTPKEQENFPKIKSAGTFGWGSRILRLHLCRGVRWYDIKKSDGKDLRKAGALGNAECPFIAITPRSTAEW